MQDSPRGRGVFLDPAPSDRAVAAGARGAKWLIMVVQKIRQLRTQNITSSRGKHSAVRTLECSTLHPDFKLL
jgi:hypothetical protein